MFKDRSHKFIVVVGQLVAAIALLLMGNVAAQAGVLVPTHVWAIDSLTEVSANAHNLGEPVGAWVFEESCAKDATGPPLAAKGAGGTTKSTDIRFISWNRDRSAQSNRQACAGACGTTWHY